MLSVSNTVNGPIKTPAPQETAGSCAFKGKPSGAEIKKFYQVLDKLEFDMIMKNPKVPTAEKTEQLIRRTASSSVWEEIKLIFEKLLSKVSP